MGKMKATKKGRQLTALFIYLLKQCYYCIFNILRFVLG